MWYDFTFITELTNPCAIDNQQWPFAKAEKVPRNDDLRHYLRFQEMALLLKHG